MKLKIGCKLSELRGVKSKNDPLGPTGAILVAKPRRQYELLIVVVKLSVVEIWARRRLKAHIMTHTIHA